MIEVKWHLMCMTTTNQLSIENQPSTHQNFIRRSSDKLTNRTILNGEIRTGANEFQVVSMPLARWHCEQSQHQVLVVSLMQKVSKDQTISTAPADAFTMLNFHIESETRQGVPSICRHRVDNECARYQIGLLH